jgi:hypothetical protein
VSLADYAVPIVPDGITPEIGWRAWTVVEKHLSSINRGATWPPKEALVAYCSHGPEYRYIARRYGRIVPTGRIEQHVDRAGMLVGGYSYGYETSGLLLDPAHGPMPTVQLPEGWGYEVEACERDVPSESCQCGIYALRDRARLYCSPYYRQAEVVGAVSLWGKIIPGEDGYRAQFAYPLVLYTDSKLVDYGVKVFPFAEAGNDLSVRLLGGDE